MFRSAAIAASRRNGLGRIVSVRPVSFTVLSTAFGVLACGLVAALFFGTYTTHATLRGRLVPDRGVIDVHSPQFGTIVERRVNEGQHVARGDVLFVVSSDRFSASSHATQLEIAQRLEQRRRSLLQQIENTRRLARLERESLDESLDRLLEEAAKLRETIEDQRERVRLAEQTAERYDRVRAEGFVSLEQWTGRRSDLLDQRVRLQGLEREQSGIARQVEDVRSKQTELDPRYANQIADLERGVTGTDLDIAENEARRGVAITAPEAGIATGVAATVGQTVDSATPVAFVVPDGAVLHAELFATSRAIGFVRPGDAVLLRYEAFPYQKFGHQRGSVLAISRAALAASSVRGDSPGPLYQVLVSLEAQDVIAYGEPRDLRAGMAVEADVLLETRRLYEWVLEPLLSLTGGAASSAPQ